jgi:tripartite-type tricarboxylate transporter receptor subunit TctC
MRVIVHAGFALAFLCAPVAHAQNSATYPNKPVKLIVGYAPGGGTDIMARLIGQQIAGSLGESVVVENRPGAGQNIANSLVARAANDGYTLLLSSSALAVNGSLYPKLDYDPVKSFEPVAMFAQSPNVLAVPASLGVSTVKEFIDYAKKHPGKVNFSSSGAGSTQHLAAEMFKQTVGIAATHVPYKGSGPSILAVQSGDVHYTFINIPSVTPMLNGGRIKVLAITSDTRSPVLPDVPTMAEAGVAGMDVSAWYGILAPAGTPRPVIDKLNASINQAVAAKDFRAQLEQAGAEPLNGTPADFTRFLAEDIARWKQVIQTSGTRID